MKNIRTKILKLLENNSKMDTKDIAVVLGMDESVQIQKKMNTIYEWN